MIKINDKLKQPKVINASEMQPSKFYIVENPGLSSHGTGDLIFTNHCGLPKTYQVLIPTRYVQFSSNYKNLLDENILVAEVDVEINLIGYSE